MFIHDIVKSKGFTSVSSDDNIQVHEILSSTIQEFNTMPKEQLLKQVEQLRKELAVSFCRVKEVINNL